MTSYRKSLYFIGISLVLFFLARTAILGLYYQQFESLGSLDILKAFLAGLRFDLSSIVVFLSIPLLLLNLPGKWLQNRPVQLFLSTITFLIVIVGAGLLICDVMYFDYVKRHITYEMFLMSSEDFLVLAGMAFDVFLPHTVLSLLFLIFLGSIWYKILRVPFQATRIGIKSIFTYLLFVVVLVVGGRGGLGYKPITIIDAFSSGSNAYSNLVLNGVFSVSHSMLRSQDVNHHHFKQSEALKILELDNQNSKLPFQKTNKGDNTRHYNLVFVLIESLSFKYVDAFAHNGLGVTKNLDDLTARGLKFMNFYAAGQRSVEGIQATLTGIPSIIGLPTIGIGLLANYSKLGLIARNNGYSTIFVQSSKRRSLRVDAIAGSLGFESFYGKEDMPLLLEYEDVDGAKFGWDYETLMFAADKMEKTEKPFLAYIFTGTTHTPFPKLPNNLEKYPHSSDREEGFLNTINYLDWSIGKFVNRLKSKPWFKNTIFVFTADHALAHYQIGSFASKFHIPLLIYAPQVIKPGVSFRIGSQLDLFPTLIQLLNLKATYSSFGNSLLEEKEYPFAIARDGSTIGIITDKGYLTHSLKNRLETGPSNASLGQSELDLMEEKLLASDQLVFELLQANEWAE
jgi:phosphoglycerol transferase MdoB-like AlkP superfamily enzyme